MDAVYSDLTNYLKNNVFPCRTVLIFPPFNGFRRFLIHKLIEDNFASSEVAAFSIGEDITRRIVVCYKGLIREGQNKSLPSLPAASRRSHSMIEKEKPTRQRSSPAAAVYKPPAARLADSKKSKDATIPPDSKRVRRPDQQMYVPRPKRASYDNEQSRSRRHSSSRASLDSGDEKTKSIVEQNEESRLCETNATSLSESCKLLSQNESPKTPQVDSAKENNQFNNLNINLKSTTCKDLNDCSTLVSSEASANNPTPVVPAPEELSDRLGNRLDKSLSKNGSLDGRLHSEMEVECCSDYGSNIDSRYNSSSKEENPLLNNSKTCYASTSEDIYINESVQNNSLEMIQNAEVIQSDSRIEPICSKVELMETVSISSESTSGSSGSTSSSDSKSNSLSGDSKSNSSSCDSVNVQSHFKHNRDDKTSLETLSRTDSNERNNSGSCKSNSQQQNLKASKTLPVSDVLIISDTSSSSDSVSVSTFEKKTESKVVNVKEPKVPKGSRKEKHLKKSRVVDPDECDWESLYDDSGECLVPSLMEELTNSVGKVRIASVDNDYRAFQSVDERTNDGECIIEIYDFPAEFKTTDLFNIFAAYRNRNFQIKWVDDTHALGVFPCPLIADEVLACTLPFVKTRPLRLGIAESRIKARNLILPVLPPMERPKTCTALARRLVSGALGLRLPTSSQEREKEKQMLKEAREKRRLEAKQRDAAWNGTLTSDNSC